MVPITIYVNVGHVFLFRNSSIKDIESLLPKGITNLQ